MHLEATRTDLERHDDAAGHLVRPSPKKKPPRHDLRQEQVHSDSDSDLDDESDKKDRSRNFKDVGGSVIDRLVRRARDERIPAKSRETGKIVQISPDTLKERPGEYEVVESEEESGGEPKEPKELEVPEKSEEAKPSDRTKFYQEAGNALRELARDNAKLNAKLKDFGRPDSQISGFLKENPDFPAAKLFQGVDLPKGLKTLGDIKEALANAVKPSKKPKGQPKEAPSPAEGPGEAKAQPAVEAPKNGPPKPPRPKDKEPGEAPAKEAPSKKNKPKKGPETPPRPKEKKAPEQPSESSEGEPQVLDHIPSKAELYQIQKPKRRETSPDERQASLSLLTDTFPPHISAELIAKNIHPDDVRELVRNYSAAKSAGPRNLDQLISKISKVYQTDPDEVDPPTTSRNSEGVEVSFDQLTPEEQSEAMVKHQLQVSALSLAARDLLTDKLSQKGALSGKPRVPYTLASTLAETILRPLDPNVIQRASSETFNKALGEESKPLSPKAAKALLDKVSKYPGAKDIATAYLQAADYTQAKAKFLDSAEISEWDKPAKIISGLEKAEKFFQERNKEYGIPGSRLAASLFRNRVINRLNSLDPTKAKAVRGRLAELEKAEYADQLEDWHENMKGYLQRKQEHARAHAEYLSDPQGKSPPGPFLDMAPDKPVRPAHSFDKDEGSELWRSITEPPKPASPKEKASKDPESKDIHEGTTSVVDDAWDEAQQKKASKDGKFTYPLCSVMASSAKTSVYNGIDPKTNRPEPYEGWGQFHQREFGESDAQAIVASAKEWLDSPLLTVAVNEMVPDSKFRAALDLAIYAGPYNGAITANLYNELLAKVSGAKEPGRGETLLTKTANFKTEDSFLVIYGPTPVDARTLKALEGPKFAFTDDSGTTFEDGTVEARIVRQGAAEVVPGHVSETLIRINYPSGSAPSAIKVATQVLGSLSLKAEQVTTNYIPSSRVLRESSFVKASNEERLPVKASVKIQKFAAQVAKTNPKLALEMTAYAGRLAEEEQDGAKKQQKEASSRYTSIKSLIIRQASTVEASQREPWLPVLQALKDSST